MTSTACINSSLDFSNAAPTFRSMGEETKAKIIDECIKLYDKIFRNSVVTYYSKVESEQSYKAKKIF